MLEAITLKKGVFLAPGKQLFQASVRRKIAEFYSRGNSTQSQAACKLPPLRWLLTRPNTSPGRQTCPISGRGAEEIGSSESFVKKLSCEIRNATDGLHRKVARHTRGGCVCLTPAWSANLNAGEAAAHETGYRFSSSNTSFPANFVSEASNAA